VLTRKDGLWHHVVTHGNVIADSSGFRQDAAMQDRDEPGQSATRVAADAAARDAAAEPSGEAEALDWKRVMALSWRPAWSIRSRRGAWAAVRAFWRERRQG